MNCCSHVCLKFYFREETLATWLTFETFNLFMESFDMIIEFVSFWESFFTRLTFISFQFFVNSIYMSFKMTYIFEIFFTRFTFITFLFLVNFIHMPFEMTYIFESFFTYVTFEVFVFFMNKSGMNSKMGSRKKLFSTNVTKTYSCFIMDYLCMVTQSILWSVNFVTKFCIQTFLISHELAWYEALGSILKCKIGHKIHIWSFQILQTSYEQNSYVFQVMIDMETPWYILDTELWNVSHELAWCDW